MTVDAAALTAVEARLRAARESRTAIAAITHEYPGFDLDSGYAVQRLAAEHLGQRVGWKLGLTSRAKQLQLGIERTIHGPLATGNVLELGANLEVGALVAPRAEPEIAFVIGRNLSGAAVTALDVLRATEAVAVGIEVPDSRFAGTPSVVDIVADNASAGRFVVGTPVPLRDIELRLVGVVFEKNGVLVATASGAAALGHPAAAVAELVRALAATDDGVRAGEVVLSGGLTVAVPLVAGDVVTASIDRLGTVELGCR